MYHTPYLRSWFKRVLPYKLNELIGLQHCKIYIFDNTVIISGANLSKDYFTNRQDRYIVIENCELLADYFCGLVATIASFSLEMNENGKFSTNEKLKSHPFLGNLEEFIMECSDKVNTFLEEQR